MLALFLKRHRGQEQNRKAAEVDANPVYGFYYHPSGERIDGGVVEVVDGNNYYQ